MNFPTLLVQKKTAVSIFLILFCVFNASAQVGKFTLSGHIKDEKTGEEIIGAVVLVKGTQVGVTTNVYGYYSMTLLQGKYTIVYKFLGYEDVEKELVLDKNTTYNIELATGNVKLKQVEIIGKKDETVQEKRMGVVSMDMKTIKTMPAFMGEVDVLKSIQLMPGVQSAGEGSSGFNVRGGGTDQNLILLDEATVYNASHLFGFFSVFNSDAIKDIEVYKGGIPAKYGGRLASLLDVRMKDGNSKHFTATGGLGLISSRLTLEGPIVKEKGSFIISGRRTYADLFLMLAPESSGLRGNRLYFYDFNLKGNYRINENNRVYLSGYFGRDVLSLAKLFGFNWGNATQTLRWNHLFNKRLFSNLTAISSDFNYGIEIDFNETQNFKLVSRIRDYGLKADLSYYVNPKHSIYFGANSTYHEFNPGEFSPLRSTSIITSLALAKKYALESSLYVEHDAKFTESFKIRYGIRAVQFNNYGKATEYNYEADNRTVIDTIQFKSGQLIKSWLGLEPRFSLSYSINETNALKFTYDRTLQFIHQASNTASTLPTDQWIPSGLHVRPQVSNQVAMGYFRQLKKGFEASVESYYKVMDNQIDFRDNAILVLNENIDREILRGRGWSYGAEFLVKKNTGNTTGWVSYTWSKTERQIDGINNGKAYFPVNDRRHNLSVVVSQKVKERYVFAATWVYYTGKPASFPRGSYEFDGNVIPFYTERNGYRLPDYHRLDLSFTIENNKAVDRRFESSWNFSVYNAYNRHNTSSIVFRQKTDANGFPTAQPEAVSIALFKIIPSVTWNFKF